MNNVHRRCSFTVCRVKSVQTLKEAYPKDGQQLWIYVSTEKATLSSPYRKKYPRLAKHPSNAYLHGPNVLVAVEHGD